MTNSIVKNQAYQLNPELEQCNDLYYLAEVATDGYFLYRVIDGKIGGTIEADDLSFISFYQMENYQELVKYN